MKKVALGIDIGGTNTQFGIVDQDGQIYTCGSLLTADFELVDDFLHQLHHDIESKTKEVEDQIEIAGIGIGAPNGNYYKGTIEYAPNLKWKGVIDFVKLCKKYYHFPIFLTNDANAAAIGEMVYGNAKGMRDFIVITLGTGLGSGIVVNGEVVYGHDGVAGEIGHTIVDPEGRLCGCGRRGCLETYASATGIRRTVWEKLQHSTVESELRQYKDFEEIRGKMIEQAALHGDPIALEAFEYTGKILGLKLADAVAHTNPEAIFLFGGLAQAGDLIFNPTNHYMNLYMLQIYRDKVKLLPSGLKGAEAAILGAAALVWKEL